jgi:hypothetical protein
MYEHVPDHARKPRTTKEIALNPVTISIYPDGTVTANCEIQKTHIVAINKHLDVMTAALCTVNDESFISLWNEFAGRNNWMKLKSLNKILKTKVSSARKDFPEIEQWRTILRGMEMHPFFSGKTGQYTRPKAMTLFFKSRYFEFYDDADSEPLMTPTESILDKWRSM